MNTDKQRIYNGDWKTLHPYSGSAPTDLYYITLANKVLAAIRAVETSLEESDYRKIDETEQKELACILTAYFEDIISQTGIFQAFTRIHGKRFGSIGVAFRFREPIRIRSRIFPSRRRLSQRMCRVWVNRVCRGC